MCITVTICSYLHPTNRACLCVCVCVKEIDIYFSASCSFCEACFIIAQYVQWKFFLFLAANVLMGDFYLFA